MSRRNVLYSGVVVISICLLSVLSVTTMPVWLSLLVIRPQLLNKPISKMQGLFIKTAMKSIMKGGGARK